MFTNLSNHYIQIRKIRKHIRPIRVLSPIQLIQKRLQIIPTGAYRCLSIF
jgi:hypothetical protein